MEQIKTYFCVGDIYKSGPQSLQFRIQSTKDLAKVIDHFDKYPLTTQKRADYVLFKQALLLIQNKEHLTEAGLAKIVDIKASMNRGLSVQNELKAAFSKIIPVTRPSAVDPNFQDPN